MKAVHYEGAFKVSVKEVDMPKIQHPDDVIIKVTTAGTYKIIVEKAVLCILHTLRTERLTRTTSKLFVAVTYTCIKAARPPSQV